MQNFVAISLLQFGRGQNEIVIQFELWWENRLWNWHQFWSSMACLHDFPNTQTSQLTLPMWGLEYSRETRSIPCLLVPWLLASPAHQQPWYWLCEMGIFLSFLMLNFVHLQLFSAEEWYDEMQLHISIYWKKISIYKELRHCPYLADGRDHVFLQLQQPFLHLATSFRRWDDITQQNDLPLATLHMCDVQDVCELETSNSLKALLQVRLHTVNTWSGGFDKLRSRQNGCNFTDNILKCIFFSKSMYMYFDSNFTKICSQGSN